MSKKSRSTKTTQPLWLRLFDQYALIVLSGILLAFIPLYPKLPLFDLIEGYIVRARIEDLLLGLTGIVWFIQLLRKKVSLTTPLTPAIVAYAIAGFLTLVSAVFLTGTVPLETIHVSKSVLHYVRYLEYFSLFFILYSTVKTRRQLMVLLGIVFATLIGVIAYGYGQKHWYWPLYSTMNREFSKGIRLYLDANGRVQSTFGGHYDMAAYLVVVTPFVLSQFFTTTKKRFKLFFGALYLAATWLLMVSGSRSSFVGYLAGNLLSIPLIAFHKERKWFKRALFTIGNGFLLTFIFVIFMLSFGQDMYARFLQTLAGYPEVDRRYHLAFGRTKIFVLHDVPLALGLKEEQFKQISDALPKAEVPANGISSSDAAALVASDQRPITQKPGEPIDPTVKPPDVTVDVPDKKMVASISATGEIIYIEIEVPREYSETAQKRGLSEAIRLDTLWPQAVRGFLANPVFGSGYATLNKSEIHHFTEAESTDNNFLRTLGETGLFGFITFYGTILLVAIAALRQIRPGVTPHPLVLSLNVAILSASFGLLINATYIDVYAASKVAMTYWALVGLVLAANTILPASTPKVACAVQATGAQNTAVSQTPTSTKKLARQSKK
jgi:hypothetical protein